MSMTTPALTIRKRRSFRSDTLTSRIPIAIIQAPSANRRILQASLHPGSRTPAICIGASGCSLAPAIAVPTTQVSNVSSSAGFVKKLQCRESDEENDTQRFLPDMEDTANEDISALRTTIQQKDATIASLQTTLQHTRCNHDAIAATAAQHANTIQKLETLLEYKSAENAVDATAAKATQHRDTIQKLGAFLEQKSAENTILETAAAQVNSEIAHHAATTATLSELLGEKDKQIVALHAALASARSTSSAVMQKQSDLDNPASHASATAAVEVLRTLRGTVMARDNEIWSLIADTTALKAALRERDAELLALRTMHQEVLAAAELRALGLKRQLGAVEDLRWAELCESKNQENEKTGEVGVGKSGVQC